MKDITGRRVRRFFLFFLADSTPIDRLAIGTTIRLPRSSSRCADLDVVQRDIPRGREFRERGAGEGRGDVCFYQQREIRAGVGFAVEGREEGLQDDFAFGRGGGLGGLDAQGAGGAEAVGEGEVRAFAWGESFCGG